MQSFAKPIKRYYFGKLRYGTPYFNPRHYNPTILSIRRLILKSKDDRDEYIKQYPHLKNAYPAKFNNMPMVLRCKYWVIKIFNTYFLVQIGWPFRIIKYGLGWKDKWDSPRFEWCPSFQIYLFGIQFCMWWCAPDKDDDLYYEMKLWIDKYCKGDIDKARKTWGWVNHDTKESTWNEKYIINE